VNTFLAFLDLAGVALIGITSAILIRGLQALPAGDQVSRFLNYLNLDGLTSTNLLILLGGTAIFFFVMKTILSVYFLRRTLRYMSIRNAQISSSLVSKMLNQPVEKIFSKSIQHQIYNVTLGVERLVGDVVTNLVVVASDLVLLISDSNWLNASGSITSIGTFFVFTGIGFLLYFLLHKRVVILNTKFTYESIYFNQKVSEGINSFRDLFIKGGREFYVNEIRKTKMKLAGYDAEIKFIPNISKYTIEISVILGIAVVQEFNFTCLILIELLQLYQYS
jgi:ATP-binding cassette, subfamily B, bacterial PglK